MHEEIIFDGSHTLCRYFIVYKSFEMEILSLKAKNRFSIFYKTRFLHEIGSMKNAIFHLFCQILICSVFIEKYYNVKLVFYFAHSDFVLMEIDYVGFNENNRKLYDNLNERDIV